MPMLAVDTTSHEWGALVSYIEKRIEELTETCTSTVVSDEQRRTAAHRIEELRDIMNAPKLTRAATVAAQSMKPVEVY